MAKIMGIDYGTKRVGVAITDEAERVAFPKAALPNDRTLMRDLVQMIKDEGVTEVVVGESKNSSGGDNEVTKNIRKFMDDLAREAGVTIHTEPEFYSTQEVRTHTGQYLVDAQAAAIILNSFLTKRNPMSDYGHND